MALLPLLPIAGKKKIIIVIKEENPFLLSFVCWAVTKDITFTYHTTLGSCGSVLVFETLVLSELSILRIDGLLCCVVDC